MKKNGMEVSTRAVPLVDDFAELPSTELRFGAASTQQDTKDPAGFVRKFLDLENMNIATPPAHRRDATGMAPGHQSPLARGGPSCLPDTMHSYTNTRGVRQRNILHMLWLWRNKWVIETTTHVL